MVSPDLLYILAPMTGVVAHITYWNIANYIIEKQYVKKCSQNLDERHRIAKEELEDKVRNSWIAKPFEIISNCYLKNVLREEQPNGAKA